MVRKYFVLVLGILLFLVLHSKTYAFGTKDLSPCLQWVDIRGNNISAQDAANKIDAASQLPAGVAGPIRDEANVKCVKVDTAIGAFDTDPAKFVQRIFSLVLGLAGGIALILIIMAGLKFMTSQGNPEKVKSASEGLTSAIIGLLFIIFAFVILEIVGVDILRIPGFQ